MSASPPNPNYYNGKGKHNDVGAGDLQVKEKDLEPEDKHDPLLDDATAKLIQVTVALDILVDELIHSRSNAARQLDRTRTIFEKYYNEQASCRLESPFPPR
uniref:Uncharacterized protein n=1 Tax=Moniliophthora roreri TaxID=221103 RepID=A0A0W0FG17_MONRR